MTSRYRVEYHLKSHRRDELIEWIKGLLVVPFVLVRELPSTTDNIKTQESVVKDRYASVFSDVEGLIDDHSMSPTPPTGVVGDLRLTVRGVVHQDEDTPMQSKLKMLVPTIGVFFTPLPLKKAFLTTEPRRAISQRRFVAPSFNGITSPFKYLFIDVDIRRVLASAQLLALTDSVSPRTKLKLITFDGDVTLYPDGSTLHSQNPVIPHLISLLSRGLHIGIVTAAGYPEPHGKEYSRRLHGLLDAVAKSPLTRQQKENLALIGGECNYLFRFNAEEMNLEWVDEGSWQLDEMAAWSVDDINTLLDIAEHALRDCAHALRLKCKIIRKQRAVGPFSPPSLASISELTCRPCPG
jgi:IMP and pyridine-specific 5'-nucleotidase